MSQLTKKAIAEAFIELLNERPLDKIKIKDITDRCGVARNTFYYHFADIPALLESIFTEETRKIILSREDVFSWEDSFISAAQFALENKRLIYHIYNSVERENLERYLSEEDKKLIEDFYRSALVGLILDWLGSGMKYDPLQYIKRVGSMLRGNIELVLEKLQK